MRKVQSELSTGFRTYHERKSASHFEERFAARRVALGYFSVYRGLMDRGAHRLKLVVDGVPALRSVAPTSPT
jgi:hypothetical protein